MATVQAVMAILLIKEKVSQVVNLVATLGQKADLTPVAALTKSLLSGAKGSLLASPVLGSLSLAPQHKTLYFMTLQAPVFPGLFAIHKGAQW